MLSTRSSATDAAPRREDEECPGCGVRLPRHGESTHPYIGASPACWALQAALLIGETADADLSRHVPRSPELSAQTAKAVASIGSSLMIDAYAAQHPGAPSPQAIQSVAIHLLTLHGVIERGVASENAMWVRKRPLRWKGVFRWLEPPDLHRTLTVADVALASPSDRLTLAAMFAGSVYDAWAASHRDVLIAWYDRYVLTG